MRWDNDLVRADGVPFTYSGAQEGGHGDGDRGPLIFLGYLLRVATSLQGKACQSSFTT
jgi:hypothetical protein